jgi:superfamily I DNA/RNA helicase
LGLRRRNVGLLETYRCCPYIVSLASKFIFDQVEREEYQNQNRIPPTGKETPLLYIASDYDDEIRSLAETIRTRQNMGERIAILVPQKILMFGLSAGLAKIGVKVEMPRQSRFSDDGLDFMTAFPKIMPYPSAKGLTFDSVLIPRLVRKYYGNNLEDLVYKMLFVAITRATKWVYMSTINAADLKLFKGIAELTRTNEITVRRNEQEPNLFLQHEVISSQAEDNDPEEKNEIFSEESDELTGFF